MLKKKRKLTLSLVDEKVHDLPLLPAVVCELMSLSNDTTNFFEKVTTLSKSDPALATRILQIVNSAASAPAHNIMNLNQALIRVGVDKILSLISILSVIRVFTPTTEQQKEIWKHSIETAIFSEFLTLHIKEFQINRNLAYTCGLLHDIGRFVMFELSSKAIDTIESKGWNTPLELPELEHKLIGFTHAEVGYLAAKRWNLPSSVTNVIHYHYHYGIWSATNAPTEIKQLITIIQFADSLSVFIDKNPGWSDWDDGTLEQEIRKFCIHKSWPDINFPIELLIRELPIMNNECNQAMEDLRLY